MSSMRRDQLIVAAVAFVLVIAACFALTLLPQKEKTTPVPQVQLTPTAPHQLPAFTATPPKRAATVAPVKNCCMHCGANSKPCGDACISKSKTCNKRSGCACGY